MSIRGIGISKIKWQQIQVSMFDKLTLPVSSPKMIRFVFRNISLYRYMSKIHASESMSLTNVSFLWVIISANIKRMEEVFKYEKIRHVIIAVSLNSI